MTWAPRSRRGITIMFKRRASLLPAVSARRRSLTITATRILNLTSAVAFGQVVLTGEPMATGPRRHHLDECITVAIKASNGGAAPQHRRLAQAAHRSQRVYESGHYNRKFGGVQ